MPFVSQAQRAACYAQQSRDLAAGRTPQWRCHDYEHGIHKKRKGKGGKTKRKVYTGPRGGKYVMFQRRKVYIKRLR